MDNNGVSTPAGSRDLAPTLHGVDFAVCAISAIIVALRIFTRIVVTKDIGIDDYTILLTLALVAAGKTFVYYETIYALGRHKAAVAKVAYQLYLKWDLIDWVQTVTVLAVSKIAICLFLLRLTHFHRLRYTIWSMIAFIIVSHVPFIVLLVLRCRPITKYWIEDLPGTCAPKKVTEIVLIIQGVISILVDIICAACPIILLHNAKIKRRVKIQLCILMGFGFLTAVACCIRTGFSYQVKSDDLSWVSVPSSIARMVEVNMGVWAACTPMMKPFVRYVRAKHGSSKIRHPSISNISFWHRSWWQSSNRRQSSKQIQAEEGISGEIVGRKHFQSISAEGNKVGRKAGAGGSGKDPRIPSLSFGDSFRMSRVDNGGNMRYVEAGVRDTRDTRNSSDATDATLVGKSFLLEDEKV